jgi:hypothetical protein
MDNTKHQPKWFAGPWIATLLGLFVVIGIIFWAVTREGPVEDITETEAHAVSEPAATTGISAPTRDYLEFSGVVPDGDEPPPFGLKHEYTAEGIRKLATALEALAKQHPTVAEPRLAGDFRASADRLEQDPTSTDHADIVRRVFISAAEIIDGLDETEGKTLRELAETIDPNRPLLEQQSAVRMFFRQSAEAIERHSDQL